MPCSGGHHQRASGGRTVRPDTVLLLQGAFSHNAFTLKGDPADRGAFRDVIEKKKVRGAIVNTPTRNDKAVGTAYPIASRISGVIAAALGSACGGSDLSVYKWSEPEHAMQFEG
jgi:hypothetical protein